MRAINRLLAAVLALAIAGAGVLIALEVLVARTGWPQEDPLVVPWDRWREDLRPHGWDETNVRLLCIAAIVLGLLLLIAALAARERRVQLTSADTDVDLSTSRSSLARALRKEATTVDGVGSAKAKIKRHSARVRARSRFGSGPNVREELQNHLQERLTSLSPVPARDLDVEIRAVERKKR